MLSQVRNSDDHEGLVRVVDSLEEKFRSWFNNRYQPIKHIVGTGGNLECIGGLRRLLLGQKSDRLIRTDELYILIGILTGLTYSQRRRELNLRPDRADVLVPAMMVCKMVFRVVEKSKICIPRVGLRDGLILALSENAPSSSPV
jgi:exopolyphosphatase/guanosine-5'-triphosphate,3'-diphosphate pyrophosphatase